MAWDELFDNAREYTPGQATLDLPTGGGVYLLTDEQDRLIQLASAADLRRAVLNRLASPPQQQQEQPAVSTLDTPNPTESPASSQTPTVPEAVAPAGPSRRRADLSQIVRRIRWRPTHSVFEATYEYYRLARVILSGDYLDNVAFGPAWFVHVDSAAAIPRFAVGKWVTMGAGVTLGPFATQQDANRFVQVLEDVFDLCRYVHILEQAPHGQACAYFEMGRCPAPCNGSIPMSQYRETIATALRFACGERDAVRREWQEQMRIAAGRLEFERAAAIKQRMERARGIEHAAFRYVRPIEAFSWLIVQRAGGRTRVRPFFVRGGCVQAGDVARLKDLEQVVPQWLERMRANDGGPDSEISSDAEQLSKELSEQIWLVSHFLFRRERTGLFLHESELGDAAGLVDVVREAFETAKPVSDESSSTEGVL